MTARFDFDSWDGRFALMDDGDLWLVHAIGENRSRLLLAAESSREAALKTGRRMASACISAFVPSRRWILGRREEAKQLYSLGARYDPDFSSWFIPETLSGPNLVLLEKRLPRGPKRYWQRYAGLVAEEARRSLPQDRIALDVSYRDHFKVKALGAQYSAKRKLWFVSRNGPLDAFAQWIHEGPLSHWVEDELPDYISGPQYLRVPYDFEFRARDAGALYLKSRKIWIAPEKSLIEDFADWLEIPDRLSPRESFRRKLLEQGFDPARPENAEFTLSPDGKKHRFFVKDDFQRPSGEYAIFLNEIPTGWITNYRTRQYLKWVYPFGGDYEEILCRVLVF